MKHLLLFLILLSPTLVFADCPRTTLANLPALSREYRELRKTPSEPKPSTEFIQHKAEVMDQLRQCLDYMKADRKLVVDTLGAPDRIVKKGELLYKMAFDSVKFSETPPHLDQAKEALIYEWRGLHDFMFFLMDGKKVILSSWWAALE